MGVHQHSAIILASTSLIRKRLLTEAGLRFEVVASPFDEEKAKESFSTKSPFVLGSLLAQHKALPVSEMFRDALVIGADQICVVGAQIIHKPGSRENAIRQLRVMQGKQHSQICSWVVCRDGKVLTQQQEIATLWMRRLQLAEIETYVDLDSPLAAAGGYHFESFGKHLFHKVVGSDDVIKGLPVVALLAWLYTHKYLSLQTKIH